jgi:hypothetical protein
MAIIIENHKCQDFNVIFIEGVWGDGNECEAPHGFSPAGIDTQTS